STLMMSTYEHGCLLPSPGHSGTPIAREDPLPDGKKYALGAAGNSDSPTEIIDLEEARLRQNRPGYQSRLPSQQNRWNLGCSPRRREGRELDQSDRHRRRF